MILRAACGALILAGCASVSPPPEATPDALAARVAGVLERRGLMPDALESIDRLVRPAPPAFAPALVREAMAKPLLAVDAATIFNRSVPLHLRRLIDEAAAPPVDQGPADVRDIVNDYVMALASAQRALRAAARGPFDADAVLRELPEDLLVTGQVDALLQAMDAEALRRAGEDFLGATARFIEALRGSQLRWPGAPLHLETEIGLVIIGGPGDDTYEPGAALIVDPGGDDVYRRAPVIGGGVSVIVDFAGSDRYEGTDIAVHGLSAIVDFSGDDRYRMNGPGIGAAIAGVSLVLDFRGDDTYEAWRFGQGAALLGLGALVDLRGDDRYQVDSGGQGFGAVGGTGLLWDHAGNDRYLAAGPPDKLDRGGGLSFAQGAGLGLRTRYGGGTGILRDDGGDDEYEAQMFAQGTAYWYAAGLLWDRGGNDRYRAVRYAQGCGVHLALGVLRDDAGDDRYGLTVGVGQGMGLDLAVGVLYDGHGNDHYAAPDVAQGAATANGVGLLYDAGGRDLFALTSVIRIGWGRAQWRRGHPALGLVLHGPGATFEYADKPKSLADSRAFGGLLGAWPREDETE